jgi:uncharacterized repeat protein (TIGR03803 family)
LQARNFYSFKLKIKPMKIYSSILLLLAFLSLISIKTTQAQTQQVYYGMTADGGQFGGGTIFKYYPATHTLVDVHDFDTAGGTGPDGTLVRATDGNLYGFTNNGGLNNLGVIFQYNPNTNTYTKEYDFGSGASGNFIPVGWLTQFTDGKFYGVSVLGGSDDQGNIYSFDPVADTYTDVHDFSAGNGGETPFSALTVFNNKLYGANTGAIYSFDPSGNAFSSSGSLGTFYGGVLAVNNQLYGMKSGGALYRFNTSDTTLTVLANSPVTNGTYSHLVLANNGYIYGMTGSAVNQVGSTIFRFDTATNVLTDVYSFDSVPINGYQAQAGLMQASDGLLYGLTTNGGDSSGGVIFSFNDSTNTYTKVFDFNTATGYDPLGNLIEVTENVGTGVHDVAALSNITLYPNPASSRLTVELQGLMAGSVANITDMAGRTVLSNAITSSDRYVFDIGALAPGLYLITIRQAGLNYTTKFAKGE